MEEPCAVINGSIHVKNDEDELTVTPQDLCDLSLQELDSMEANFTKLSSLSPTSMTKFAASPLSPVSIQFRARNGAPLDVSRAIHHHPHHHHHHVNFASSQHETSDDFSNGIMPPVLLGARERDLETRAMVRKKSWGTLATSWLVKNCFAAWRSLMRVKITSIVQVDQPYVNSEPCTCKEMKQLLADKNILIQGLKDRLRDVATCGMEQSRLVAWRSADGVLNLRGHSTECHLYMRLALTAFHVAVSEAQSAKRLAQVERQHAARIAELSRAHETALLDRDAVVARIAEEYELNLKRAKEDLACAEHEWGQRLRQTQIECAAAVQSRAASAAVVMISTQLRGLLSAVLQVWLEVCYEIRMERELARVNHEWGLQLQHKERELEESACQAEARLANLAASLNSEWSLQLSEKQDELDACRHQAEECLSNQRESMSHERDIQLRKKDAELEACSHQAQTQLADLEDEFQARLQDAHLQHSRALDCVRSCASEALNSRQVKAILASLLDAWRRVHACWLMERERENSEKEWHLQRQSTDAAWQKRLQKDEEEHNEQLRSLADQHWALEERHKVQMKELSEQTARELDAQQRTAELRSQRTAEEHRTWQRHLQAQHSVALRQKVHATFSVAVADAHRKLLTLGLGAWRAAHEAWKVEVQLQGSWQTLEQAKDHHMRELQRGRQEMQRMQQDHERALECVQSNSESMQRELHSRELSMKRDMECQLHEVRGVHSRTLCARGFAAATLCGKRVMKECTLCVFTSWAHHAKRSHLEELWRRQMNQMENDHNNCCSELRVRMHESAQQRECEIGKMRESHARELKLQVLRVQNTAAEKNHASILLAVLGAWWHVKDQAQKEFTSNKRLREAEESWALLLQETRDKHTCHQRDWEIKAKHREKQVVEKSILNNAKVSAYTSARHAWLLLMEVFTAWLHTARMYSHERIAQHLDGIHGRLDQLTANVRGTVTSRADCIVAVLVLSIWQTATREQRCCRERNQRCARQLEGWGSKYGAARSSVLWHRVFVLWRLCTKLELWKQRLSRASRGHLLRVAQRLVLRLQDGVCAAFMAWLARSISCRSRRDIDNLRAIEAFLSAKITQSRDCLLAQTIRQQCCIDLQTAIRRWVQMVSDARCERSLDSARGWVKNLQERGSQAKSRMAQKVLGSQDILLAHTVISAWRRYFAEEGTSRSLSDLRSMISDLKHRAASALHVQKGPWQRLARCMSLWRRAALEGKGRKDRARLQRAGAALAIEVQIRTNLSAVLVLHGALMRWRHLTAKSAADARLKAAHDSQAENGQGRVLAVIISIQEHHERLVKWEAFARWSHVVRLAREPRTVRSREVVSRAITQPLSPPPRVIRFANATPVPLAPQPIPVLEYRVGAPPVPAGWSWSVVNSSLERVHSARLQRHHLQAWRTMVANAQPRQIQVMSPGGPLCRVGTPVWQPSGGLDVTQPRSSVFNWGKEPLTRACQPLGAPLPPAQIVPQQPALTWPALSQELVPEAALLPPQKQVLQLSGTHRPTFGFEASVECMSPSGNVSARSPQVSRLDRLLGLSSTPMPCSAGLEALRRSPTEPQGC